MVKALVKKKNRTSRLVKFDLETKEYAKKRAKMRRALCESVLATLNSAPCGPPYPLGVLGRQYEKNSMWGAVNVNMGCTALQDLGSLEKAVRDQLSKSQTGEWYEYANRGAQIDCKWAVPMGHVYFWKHEWKALSKDDKDMVRSMATVVHTDASVSDE